MSLLDQWEDEISNAGLVSRDPGFSFASRSDTVDYEVQDPGYVVPLEREIPIFSFKRVDYGAADHGRAAITAVAGSQRVLVIANSRSHIIRWNQETDQTDDIEISKRPEDAIHRLYIDPWGFHVIITMVNGENYYLHSSSKKPKHLSKLRGFHVESVAWDRSAATEQSERRVLLGTRQAVIFECVLHNRDVASMKPVFEFADKSPLFGLQYEQFPVTSAPNGGGEAKFFVMVATTRKYYQFIGGPTFEQLFFRYQENPAQIQKGSKELPGDISFSELHFFSKHHGRANSFAWLTGAGIYHGSLVFGSQNMGEGVVHDCSLVPYPKAANPTNEDDLDDPVGHPPLSMAITEFHFVLQYPDQFMAVSQLSKQPVYSEFCRERDFGKIRGFARDPLHNNIWLFSDRFIYELMITKESRDVWKLYLSMGRYEEALKYCSDNPSNMDKVLTSQADHYFHEGSFKLAASIYASTQKPFEEVALKFLQADQSGDALQTFLLTKLKSLSKEDKTQKTLLCTWLTEIFLDRLNTFKATGRDDAFRSTQEDFRSFMTSNKESLNDTTTYQLLQSHGRIDELLFYAELNEHYERVIMHHMTQQNFQQALSKLKKVQPPQRAAELFYKFAPVLMRHEPQKTASALIESTQLDPSRLVAAMMCTPDPEKKEAIRYLEFATRRGLSIDSSVHNLLLSLYAEKGKEEDLLEFINSQGGQYHFDLKYALRTCTQHNKSRACVQIYSLMGLFEEAVDLALSSGDLTLAKVNANKPEEDEELRRKLWLRIAHWTLQHDSDVQTALALMKESELLRIEDLLPSLPDFVLIDNFKEEICESLEDYNRRIEELKSEMRDYTSSSELVRNDMRNLRNRCGYVSADQICDLCYRPALARQFYLFPCGHVMHSDCLCNKILPELDLTSRHRVGELQKQISMETAPKQASPMIGGKGESTKEADGLEQPKGIKKIDQLKAELDDILASECPLCGDILIRSVNMPFLSLEDSVEERLEADSWKL